MNHCDRSISAYPDEKTSGLAEWCGLCRRYTQFKKYFSKGEQGMIGFQRGINLIFSLFNEGENMVFSSPRYENDLNNKRNLYHI